MPQKRSKRKKEVKNCAEVINITMASESSNSGIKIPTFNGSVGESARFWIAKFEQVMKLRKVKNEDRCIQLFLLLEGQAEMWYHTLSEAIQGNYEELIKAFNGRFLPSETDRIRSVAQFRALVQARDERTDDFIEKVIRLGKDLDKKEQEIIDQIYQGLDPVIVKFVAQKEAKTLSDVRRFARMGQSLEREMTTPSTEVHRVQAGQRTETGKCDFRSEKSRYQERRCYVCQGKNHIAKNCWFRHDRR